MRDKHHQGELRVRLYRIRLSLDVVKESLWRKKSLERLWAKSARNRLLFPTQHQV